MPSLVAMEKGTLNRLVHSQLHDEWHHYDIIICTCTGNEGGSHSFPVCGRSLLLPRCELPLHVFSLLTETLRIRLCLKCHVLHHLHLHVHVHNVYWHTHTCTCTCTCLHDCYDLHNHVHMYIHVHVCVCVSKHYVHVYTCMSARAYIKSLHIIMCTHRTHTVLSEPLTKYYVN